MTPMVFTEIGLNPALKMLPPEMDSVAARAMVIAICLQESKLLYRRQMNDGPARGFAQFEMGGGILGVLTHAQTRPHIEHVLTTLGYNHSLETSYAAIEHNDVLCAAFARLLLWTVPGALPGETSAQLGWTQYLSAWRPGKPHHATWGICFERGWASAKGGVR